MTGVSVVGPSSLLSGRRCAGPGSVAASFSNSCFCSLFSLPGIATCSTTSRLPWPPLSLGMPLPRSAQLAPVLAAGRHLERHPAAARGRHLDGGAQRRLGDRDRHLDDEVVAAALEEVVGLDAHAHVEVAGRSAAHAGLALALDADLAAVLDARRDLDVVPAGLVLHAGAAAGRARVLDDRALPVAARARLATWRTDPGCAPPCRDPGTPGRPWAWCPAWRRCRGRSRTCPACRRARARSRRVSASSNDTVTSACRSAPRSAALRRPRPAPPAAPPNRLPRMSPRSPTSNWAPPCAATLNMRGSKPWEPPAPGRNPPPPGPVPKAPSRLISSYCLRFSGSESVSYAELTSLNFSSAALSPGFLSG